MFTAQSFKTPEALLKLSPVSILPEALSFLTEFHFALHKQFLHRHYQTLYYNYILSSTSRVDITHALEIFHTCAFALTRVVLIRICSRTSNRILSCLVKSEP